MDYRPSPCVKWNYGEIKYISVLAEYGDSKPMSKDSVTDPGPDTKLGLKFSSLAKIPDLPGIQMEQFSRECLEIDTEAHRQRVQQPDRQDVIIGSSMDKVYDHAAKLVKRTLDVEGVIVMDVSHCDVLKSMNVEGTVSVILHYGDPQMDAKERQLSVDEFHQLNAFFAKHPDGKISDGIIPSCFRPFLPAHIQYALSKLYSLAFVVVD